MKALLFIMTVGVIGLSSASAFAIDCDKSESGDQLCISISDDSAASSKQETAQTSSPAAVDKQVLGSEVSGGALTAENDLRLFSTLNPVNAGEVDINGASLQGLADAERVQAQLASIDVFLRSSSGHLLGSNVITTSGHH